MAPRLLPLLLLHLALLLLQAATSGRPQAECAAGQELALALAYATNATGHRRVEARLEQPLGGGWEVEVRVEAVGAGCGPGGAPRRSLALTLLGPPEGPLPAPSLRHESSFTPSPCPTPSCNTHSPSPAPSPSPSPSPTPSSPPPGYTTLPGLGHYRAASNAFNWMDASALCRREGGALAVPTSLREVEELLTRFPRNATGAAYSSAIWVGISDIEEEGKFVTEDGVPLEDSGFAEFDSGEPNGGRDQNCIMLWYDKTLGDCVCKEKLSFVCKVPL